MRTFRVLSLCTLSVAIGCGASPAAPPPAPMSAADHMAEAERHERQADGLTERPDVAGEPGEPSITQAGLDTTLTSGGEPLLRPRWTSSISPATRHKHQAERLREHAAEHRRTAKGLLDAEKRACAGLTQEEIDLGPFFHSEDIDRVEALDDGGRVAGARIRFLDVEDLTVPWMKRSVECARARAAALGYPRDDVHDSPLMLRDIDTDVSQRGAFIEVVIRAKDPAMGVAVLQRARAAKQGDGTAP